MRKVHTFRVLKLDFDTIESRFLISKLKKKRFGGHISVYDDFLKYVYRKDKKVCEDILQVCKTPDTILNQQIKNLENNNTKLKYLLMKEKDSKSKDKIKRNIKENNYKIFKSKQGYYI